MKVTLKNIGLVESAEINIGGLTVITGHNSVGKSFIGKAIYSAVKANQNFQNKVPETHPIRERFAHLNQRLITKFSSINRPLLDIINSESWSIVQEENPTELYKNIQTFIQKIQQQFPEIFNVTEIQQLLKTFNYTDYKTFNKIQFRLAAHDFFIRSNFKGAYNNILSSNQIAGLKFSEKNIPTLEVKTSNNNTISFIAKNLFPYNDITYIETPIILSLVSYIRDNLAFSEKRSSLLPQYIVDLVQKLVEGGYDTPTNTPLYNSIIKTISGQLAVDNNQVVYKDEANNSYNINNVASGIKSFGIIQLLLAGGSINPNSILIIDEPEVHLHPEWQLEYAKLLVELVKNNIPVIVTSHSPYFVEALKVYSDKAKISDKTHFYLGEMGKKGSTFKDVSQNLDLLFEKFSAPMLKLIVEK